MATDRDSKPRLRVGDRIKDNDPRMPRELRIVRLDRSYVYAVTSFGKETRLLRGYVHTDGKPRKSGFSLVQPA